MPSSIGPVEKLQFFRRVAGDKRLNATDLRCCILIADYYNSTKGRAWPSYNRLCVEAGAGRASIARSVRKLDALGIISRIGGRLGRSNSYIPDFEVKAELETKESASDTPSQVRDVTSSGDEITSVAAVRPNPSTTPRSNQRRGGSSNPTGLAAFAWGDAAARGAPGGNYDSDSVSASASVGPSGPEGFDEFWEAYPKKEGRRLAEAAYRAALSSGVNPATLAKKAVQYAVAKACITDPKYLKMPASWLRERCWLEDPRPPRRISRALPQQAKRAGRGKTRGRQEPKITEMRHAVIGSATHPLFGHIELVSEPTTSGFVQFYRPFSDTVETVRRSNLKNILYFGKSAVGTSAILQSATGSSSGVTKAPSTARSREASALTTAASREPEISPLTFVSSTDTSGVKEPTTSGVKEPTRTPEKTVSNNNWEAASPPRVPATKPPNETAPVATLMRTNDSETSVVAPAARSPADVRPVSSEMPTKPETDERRPTETDLKAFEAVLAAI